MLVCDNFCVDALVRIVLYTPSGLFAQTFSITGPLCWESNGKGQHCRNCVIVITPPKTFVVIIVSLYMYTHIWVRV